MQEIGSLVKAAGYAGGGQVQAAVEVELDPAFTNARGVLYHSPRIDPGVRYPPYSEHRRERALESKLP